VKRLSLNVRALPVACLLAALSHALFAQIPAATLTQANTDLQAGQADKAIAILNPLPQSGTGADVAQNLLCRVQFSLQQLTQAATACQLAVKLNGQNSDDHMWLARVLGQQASHASIFSALGLAKKSLAEMQTATQLNPQNGPALSDLGDYYAQAPGIAGGGADKAQAVATQLDKVDPARAAQLRGDIAMAAKNYTTAEQQYRQAATVSPQPADYWTVLASFYRGRQQWTNLDTAIQNCVTAAAKNKNSINSSIGLFDGAGVLIAAKRNPQLAETMLEDYLASPSLSEQAPAFIAHIRLSRLKQQLGDAAGAQQDLAAAAAMAHEFNPAQDKP
jgi:tetratricopeptide (TPR) repeat protein